MMGAVLGKILSLFSFRVILKSSLTNFYFLQSHIKSVDSGETNIDGAIGE